MAASARGCKNEWLQTSNLTSRYAIKYGWCSWQPSQVLNISIFHVLQIQSKAQTHWCAVFSPRFLPYLPLISSRPEFKSSPYTLHLLTLQQIPAPRENPSSVKLGQKNWIIHSNLKQFADPSAKQTPVTFLNTISRKSKLKKELLNLPLL